MLYVSGLEPIFFAKANVFLLNFKLERFKDDLVQPLYFMAYIV